MVDVTQNTSSESDKFKQLIWGIILLSAGLFCLICVGSSLLVYAFFFESTIPITGTVQSAQGTVVITDNDLNERGLRQDIDALTSRQVTISTDGQSQGMLQFLIEPDESDDAELLVTLNLRSNSSIRVNSALQPRFEWGRSGYSINLNEFRGELDAIITGTLQRPLNMRISAPHGEYVEFLKPGRYTLLSSNDRVRIKTYAGESTLHSPGNRNAHLILPGQEGTIYIARSEPVVSPLRTNILTDGLFTFALAETDLQDTPNTSISIPGWHCIIRQQAPPEGKYRPDQQDTQIALRLVRSNGANTNGETRCIQDFPAGYALDESNYMELTTSFYINYQSISSCGVQGSECPLMLYINYTDSNGIQRDWYRGFYYAYDPQFDYYKARCDSCSQDHQQVNEKVWYTYKSGNLFSSIPEDVRPAAINSVQFYASGHEYDVFISEIGLFAGISTDAPIQPVSVEGEQVDR